MAAPEKRQQTMINLAVHPRREAEKGEVTKQEEGCILEYFNLGNVPKLKECEEFSKINGDEMSKTRMAPEHSRQGEEIYM